MKKSIILSMATLALLASSCSNDEMVEVPTAEKTAISFAPFVDKATRAAQVDNSTTVTKMQQNANGFAVFGLMKKGAESANLAFKGTPVKYDQTSSKWTYTPVQYWEEGYNYKFIAVYPQAGTNVGAIVENYMPTWDSWGALKFQGLIGTGDYVLAVDNTYATEAIKSKTDQATVPAISFTFKHVLMKVRFAFKNVMEDQSVLSIRALKIKSYYNGGTLNISDDIENSTWSDLSQNNTDGLTFKNPEDEAKEGADNVVQQIDFEKIGYSDYKFLIPAKEVSGAKVEYVVQFIITRVLQGGTSIEYYKNATIKLPTGSDWSAGYAYTFTADLNMKAVTGDEQRPIEFTVNEVKGWDKADNATIDGIIEVDKESAAENM